MVLNTQSYKWTDGMDGWMDGMGGYLDYYVC